MTTLKACITSVCLIIFAAFSPAVNAQEPSSFFHSVVLEPAKVSEGDMLLLQAVFSVYGDSSRETLPVEYFYEIQKQEEIFFRSPVKAIKAGNGAKTVLDIKVKAAGSNGDYKMVLNLTHPDGTARAAENFSIVSTEEARAYAFRTRHQASALTTGSTVEERLMGKWRFVSTDPEKPDLKLSITKGDSNLVAQISRQNAKTHWVKLRKNNKTLILRSKSADSDGDCWYVVEDVITFNDQMDNMPVRSKILEGSQCVSVGQASNSTLSRID